jgi:hypothetical protein
MRKGSCKSCEAAYEDEQAIIRTGQSLVGREEKETWPDGSVTWASTTKLPLRDPSGTVIGTFGLSRDITDRKNAEEALALKTQELLISQGWCFWKCRKLDNEIIIITRDDMLCNIPTGYIAYTEDELAEIDRENIDEGDLHLIHNIKKYGAVIMPSTRSKS